jgi:hypothetical protein
MMDNQRSMFKMRTDLLDSYLSATEPSITSWFGHGKIIIFDLSDPFLDGANAAILFDIILGVFVEWRSCSPRNKKIIGMRIVTSLNTILIDRDSIG